MKYLFAVIYWGLLGVALPVALWRLIVSPTWAWAGVLMVAGAPLAYRLRPYDELLVPHHKVRLPRVSALVLSGLALVLLTSAPGPALWLALAGVGGFLLHTYWVRD